MPKKPFNVDRLRNLRLTFEDVRLLNWFLQVSLSPKTKKHISNAREYFWIHYPSLATSRQFPSARQAQRAIDRLCGIFRVRAGDMDKIVKADFGTYPLSKTIVQTRYGRQAYYAPNFEVIDMMRSSQAIQIASPLFVSTETGFKQPLQRRLHPEILQLVTDLLKIKIPLTDSFLFTNKGPEDATHYTGIVKNFASHVLSIYAGTWLMQYKLGTNFEYWYGAYLSSESENQIQALKGNWAKISDFIFAAAGRYRKWFLPQYEPLSKKNLAQSLDTWMFNAYFGGGGSAFLCCVSRDPFSAQEAITDQTYDSIPNSIRDQAEIMIQPSYDEQEFWRRIASVAKWYETNSGFIRVSEPNARYWFDGGIGAWFNRYLMGLCEMVGGNPKNLRVGNFGCPNPSWANFLVRSRKRHGMEIDLTLSTAEFETLSKRLDKFA